MQDGLATPEQVDRICRLGRRLPDGPVRADGPRRDRRRLRGLALVLRAVASASRAGARRRWPPGASPPATSAARPAGAGTRTRRAPATAEPEPGGGDGRRVAGDGRRSRGPRRRAARPRASEAGGEVRRRTTGRQAAPCDGRRAACAPPAAASAASTASPPLGRLVELTGRPRRPPRERFFATLGLHAEWVGDAPGLVLRPDRRPARQRGVLRARRGRRPAADIDAGMELGLNHPRGPLAWGDRSAPTGARRCSTASRRSTARSATGPRRRSARVRCSERLAAD